MGNLKQIDNPSQAFALGATWGVPSVDNTMTTEICNLINNTGVVLYTGDVVGIDATGTLANQLTTATLALAIGAVGSALEMSAYPAIENINGANVANTFPTIVGSTAGTGISSLTTDGNIIPNQLTAWQSLVLGFTNGSTNITSASAATTNPFIVGQIVYTPLVASTNTTPQVFQITGVGGSTGAWTATSVVIAGAGTTFSGTTGTFTCQVGRDNVAKGPGWIQPYGWSSSSAFEPGVIVPIVTKGFGRVNVNAIATVNAGDLLIGTNASFVSTRVASGALTAAQAGFGVAVASEAQTQKDTTLTSLGIAGHDSIRAYIKSF